MTATAETSMPADTEAPDEPGGRGDDSRQALLALLLLVPAPIIGVTLAMLALPGTVAGQVGFLVCKVWMIALPVVWHLAVDRRRPSLSPARQGGFAVGAVTGLAIAGAMLGVWWLFGAELVDVDRVREAAVRNGIASPAKFIGLCAYWILVNSLVEEVVYRWFIVRKAERLAGTRWAVVISAAAFTLHHIIALAVQFDWRVTLLGTIAVFVGGLIWSWMYVRYRSIWPGYLSHAIVDVGMYVIGWVVIFG